MKRIILGVLCLWLIVGGFAQKYVNNPERLLTPKQMKMDATYYFYEVERTHFCPHYLLGKKEYQRAKKNIFKQIRKPMEVWEFALIMGSTNSWFDGHTVAGYIYSLESVLLKKKQFIFYDVRAEDGCFYFNDWLSIPDTLRGKRIVSINGISDTDIYNKLSKYSSIESVAYLDNRLTMYFPYLYPVLYGLTDEFNIIYQDGNATKQIVLSKADIDNWHDILRKNGQGGGNTKNLSCTFYPDYKIAIFELNSFECYDEDFNVFVKELDNAFDSLRNNGYEHLFLDITRNGGGTTSCAYAVLNNLNTPDSLVTFTAFMKGETRGEVDTVFAVFRKDRDVYYDQFVYLLQSKSSYSAAVDFCSPFKALNLGCIIGEETGGLTAGYIDSKRYMLPYASVNFYCSFKQYCNIGGAFDGRGVLPDIEYPMNNLDRSFTLDELKQFIEMCDN